MIHRATLVAADFVKTGGMDRANYALAEYLARQGAHVHLVAHRIEDILVTWPNVHWQHVKRPGGLDVFGEYALERAGKRARRATTGPFLVNGGNCVVEAVNWVHYVHALFQPSFAPGLVRMKQAAYARVSAKRERAALARAPLVIANSQGTRQALVERVGIAPERVHVVYYGIDAQAFGPIHAGERATVRQELGLSDRPTAMFVGGLGDRRKGFDTLFQAWVALCRRPSWDADLLVVGRGRELETWRRRASAALGDRVRFLGFRKDVPRLLAAADALIAPTRYEAFGLGVAEAISRGLPALVSARAGVAELYPPELEALLLGDPDSVSELVMRLERWRGGEYPRAHLAALTERVRARSWDRMAEEIAALMARVS